MKLKKQKIKYSAIFCLCWFAVLVFLVDGVLKFQTLVDYFGSYALVEICLLLLVIGGFTGMMLGVFTQGESTKVIADFDRFEYKI
jgi:hypothetical protein